MFPLEETPDERPEELLEEVRQRVRRVLRDFDIIPDGTPAPESSSIRLSVTPRELPVPQLVKLVLAWGLGAEGFGKEDKRAWLIPFLYKQRPCSIGLYKFGLRLHLKTEDSAEGEELAEQIIASIDKAVRVVEDEMLLAYAEGQVRAGNLTVKNQYHMFYGMYQDFRSKLEVEETSDDGPDIGGRDWVEAATARMNARIASERERFHLSIAMVNSFFSLLEHLLVLIWPLMGTYTPGDDDAEEMIRSRWSDKFKTVFDLNADPAAKRIYDDLRNIAEEYRNTFDHGGFDKRRGSFAVHFPGGAIPASMSESRHRIRTAFFPVAEPEIGDILKVLDTTEEWLHSGPARMPMMFLESGIDVAFDSATLSEVRGRMTCDEEFEDYLRGLSRWLDDQTNMDW